VAIASLEEAVDVVERLERKASMEFPLLDDRLALLFSGCSCQLEEPSAVTSTSLETARILAFGTQALDSKAQTLG